ncbi:MAG: DUF2786 domain-containing protein, partial [Hyphomicrobiaceae bacterium]|nr:DUF2786 domain-containing protein [Hyphomicrobiaceae bacterium]
MNPQVGRDQRQKLIHRIRALMDKTEDNGCTEAEALTAAGMVDKLMQEYDLTFKDVNVDEEMAASSFGARSRRHTLYRGGFHESAQYLCSTVAGYFDCKAFMRKADTSVLIFGEKDDSQSAHQMLAMLALAMDQEWERYRKGEGRSEHGHTIAQLRKSFMLGMAVRLKERVLELKAARSHASRGTALVVVKGQVVTDRFAKYLRDSGIQLQSRRARSFSGSASAINAGKSAGGRVDLGGKKVGGTGQLS